ncbi:MAG: branched-chain amino acid ABC transporter permease [Gammaproteobacteria bacterium]|nr:branched-chain amino acid ABC transporter permease [Gammaproteobacteria bacterium]MDH3412310.1 branched-chain amino acid ABC transporter permease [Gammaproteobacteria bacterium]
MLDNLSLLIQAPLLNIQLLLDGLLIGAIFALAAYGLALVWGVMNVKNLAQGDFVIMGGYIATSFAQHDIHPFFALPAAIVLMFGFGWLCYVSIIRRVIGRDIFVSLLATFGLALVLQQALNLIFGSDVQTADAGFKTRFFFGGQVTVADTKFIALVLAGVLAACVVLFMKKSRMGKAIRATAQDARAARVLGVNTDQVYAFTFALNSAICGAAGVLVAMIWVIQPYYGIVHSIRSFIIVVLAGLGNLPGVIFGALFLGSAEQFSSFIFGAEFQVASVVCILVLVLIYRQVQSARHRQVVE